MSDVKYLKADGTEVPRVSKIVGAYSPDGGEGLRRAAARIAAEESLRMVRDGSALHSGDSEVITIAANAHREQWDEKADTGTLTHSLIAQALGDDDPMARPVDDLPTALSGPGNTAQALGHFAGWAKWADVHRPKPLHLELPLVSERYGFGGTPDFIGHVELDGKRLLVVADWKTGSRLREEYDIKTAAYAVLVHEKLGLSADACLIVQCRNNTWAQRVMSKEHMRIGWVSFSSLLMLHHNRAELHRIRRGSGRTKKGGA